MIIVWGTTEVEKRLGYAADFCPICRDLRGFESCRVGMAGHLYGVHLGSGRRVGDIRRCLTCRIAGATTPESYVSLARRPAALEELIDATFPTIRSHYARRLALERQVEADPSRLPAELRSQYIDEPFRLIAPMAEEFFSNVRIDGYMFGVGRRWLRRTIYPKLARALSPLQPNDSEIRAAIDPLKSQKAKLGRRAKVAPIMRFLALPQNEAR
jgi:hypothetical protein